MSTMLSGESLSHRDVSLLFLKRVPRRHKQTGKALDPYGLETQIFSVFLNGF